MWVSIRCCSRIVCLATRGIRLCANMSFLSSRFPAEGAFWHEVPRVLRKLCINRVKFLEISRDNARILMRHSSMSFQCPFKLVDRVFTPLLKLSGQADCHPLRRDLVIFHVCAESTLVSLQLRLRRGLPACVADTGSRSWAGRPSSGLCIMSHPDRTS